MNKVLLTGRLTRDPEMRSLASGKQVTTFTVASNAFIGGGKERAEYHPVVAWDRLAEIAGRYLGKGQQVAIEGRIQTRSWDDKESGQKRYRTEIIVNDLSLLSGRDEGSGQGGSRGGSASYDQRPAAGPNDYSQAAEISDDDIPF